MRRRVRPVVIVDRASVVAIDPRRAVRASRSTLDAPFARPLRAIDRSIAPNVRF